MNFCENCNAAFEFERCPICGTKKIRQAQDGDFCFLIEGSTRDCEVLISVLDDNEIPHTAMPFGSGAESYLGKTLNNYRLYVPYAFLEKARGILREAEAAKTEELRALLLKNSSSFNIPLKTEKKIRKKLKLPNETNIIDYCGDIVKNADKIRDEWSYGAAWRFVFCYLGDLSITFNSDTFEILAIRRKKH